MNPPPSVLPQSFYLQDTAVVARALLGKILCCRAADGTLRTGHIVETEAYLGAEDPACHTFNHRKTSRNQSMYLEGGHAYIYLIYGMHHCLNIVTRTAAHPEAVLLRAMDPRVGPRVDPAAVPPVTGASEHAAPLASVSGAAKLVRSRLESNGPGKLCRYLGLTRAQDGVPMWTADAGLWVLEQAPLPPAQIVESTRIGVEYAGAAAAWPLRYYVRGNPYVSKK